MTLQQVGDRASTILWSAIIASSLVGGLLGQALMRRFLRPRH
jgi:hypothetical protein